jgi:hypothetical protein
VKSRLLLAVLIVLLAAASRLAAHPAATAFVVIGVAPSRIEVVLTADEQALLLKLAALSGRGAAEPGDVRDRIDLLVDERSLPLDMGAIDRPADSKGRIRITMVATLTSPAETLQWRSSLFNGSYPVAVQRIGQDIPADDRDYDWISGTASSRVYDLSALRPLSTTWSGLGRLILTGFTHIVPDGLDHVLFVLGLTFLAANLRTLLIQISLFTIAHSATLGLALAGVLAAPERIVEPRIAVSIAYVAIENLRSKSLSYWRLVLVLGFGLLHGLGFAGALRETGLSGGTFAATLAGFNIGVELGQLAVVGVAVATLRLLPWRGADQHRLILRPASAAIAAVGLFWAVERVFFV